MKLLTKNIAQTIILGSILLFTSSGCLNRTFAPELKTGAVFYNDSLNKLWKHRVNTVDDLQLNLKKFKGFELDIVYNEKHDEFEVKHDEKAESDLNLFNYFKVLPNPKEYHYWLDIKNLTDSNIQSLINRLDYIIDFYGIREFVICESWDARLLAKLNKKGYYTSYWIPHIEYSAQLDMSQQKVLAKILWNLSQCRHNAISASYTMLPFINDHLSDCSVHLWTNGLSKAEDKVLIKKLLLKDYVRVVLIDYKEPFEY